VSAFISPPETMSLAISVDRFAYCEGTYEFWAEHHGGQNSKGYSILSKILSRFSPGPLHKGWESMGEDARDVYRAWCLKEGEPCTYDHIRYSLETADCFDLEDPCVEYFLGRYGDETLENSGLVNYEHSDFVNIDMPYTRDLLNFYNQNEDSILYWADQYCDAIGANSRSHALEGQTIETPDDFATALVNLAMTYLAGSILSTLQG
jgi:hypothetical protein